MDNTQPQYNPAPYNPAAPQPPSQPQPVQSEMPASGLNKTRMRWLVGVVVFGAVLAIGLFVLEYQSAAAARGKDAALTTQLRKLHSDYATLQNVGTVSTNGWQPFCDTTNGYCFKYPKDWAVDSSADPRRNYVGASVTNPTRTVQAQYGAPYFQTSGNATFRPVKVEDFKIGSTRLKLVGGYYISSVYYTPFYVLVNEDDAKNLSTAGDTTIWDNDMRFQNGNDTVKMNVGSSKTTLTSREQAEVWFSSTDGKTAYALIKTLTTGTKAAVTVPSTSGTPTTGSTSTPATSTTTNTAASGASNQKPAQ